jgi:hypothetical protein
MAVRAERDARVGMSESARHSDNVGTRSDKQRRVRMSWIQIDCSPASCGDGCQTLDRQLQRVRNPEAKGG